MYENRVTVKENGKFMAMLPYTVDIRQDGCPQELIFCDHGMYSFLGVIGNNEPSLKRFVAKRIGGRDEVVTISSMDDCLAQPFPLRDGVGYNRKLVKGTITKRGA